MIPLLIGSWSGSHNSPVCRRAAHLQAMARLKLFSKTSEVMACLPASGLYRLGDSALLMTATACNACREPRTCHPKAASFSQCSDSNGQSVPMTWQQVRAEQIVVQAQVQVVLADFCIEDCETCHTDALTRTDTRKTTSKTDTSALMLKPSASRLGR